MLLDRHTQYVSDHILMTFYIVIPCCGHVDKMTHSTICIKIKGHKNNCTFISIILTPSSLPIFRQTIKEKRK